MISVLLSALVTCVASLFLGQAALRLCGFREWSWIAPAVGISIAMAISMTAIHAPGGCTTLVVILGSLTLAAIVWCWRAPQHRPPLTGFIAVAPVAALAVVPYIAAGRTGIQGVSMDNDMSIHLLWAESILFKHVVSITPLPTEYPIAPHAMVAVIADGLGIRIDQAFSGWVMAPPLIGAWAGMSLAPRLSLVGKLVLATVVGMPFLIAAYYGEGSFKEVLLAALVMAFVALLTEIRSIDGRRRWIPFALLLVGVLSVYSIVGLLWPGVIGGAWLLVLILDRARRRGPQAVLGAARRELPGIAIACAVLVVSVVPQIPRLANFGSFAGRVKEGDLGNLVGQLPLWEAFGVWNNPDFRLPASPAFSGGMWTAFVLGLVLFGALWALNRGRWTLPLAAGLALGIAVVSIHTQAPYTSAKALVIASPFLLALAALPLLETWRTRRSEAPLPPVIAAVLALILFVAVGWFDSRALRASPVGPTVHMAELRSLQETIGVQPTLFIGDDDFIEWELAGVPVSPSVKGFAPSVPMVVEKEWASGQALDFDTIGADTLNAYRWVITPRDSALSAPPPQLRLVRNTTSYSLWRRVGTIQRRSVLPEGEMPGAVLNCSTAEGRAIRSAGGVAAIRARPVVVEAPVVPPDGTAFVRIPLGSGKWSLMAQYFSPLPVDVSGEGLSARLPANLDRPGARWPVGILQVDRENGALVSFGVDGTALSPGTASAVLGRLIAVPLGRRERVVPVDRACGRYVDWYRSADQ